MRKVTFRIGEQEFEADASAGIDISIPMNFEGAQPNAYGVEPASAKTCEYGDLVGDTRRGGSCNFEQYTLIPHCNGTHTECVGHITEERISVRECLEDVFAAALLVTVQPRELDGCRESYRGTPDGSDQVITSRMLREAIERSAAAYFEISALIVRTLPNEPGKLSRTYTEPVPAYFTEEAIEMVNSKGIRHLLCDLPSIDRLHDGGMLVNHRKFWNLGLGTRQVDSFTRKANTVTELIFVPDEVEDGRYLLNLQVASFQSDAAPSRPLIFPVK